MVQNGSKHKNINDDWAVGEVDNNSKTEKVGSKSRQFYNAEIAKMVFRWQWRLMIELNNCDCR
jgi:hypothetical protein